MDHGKLKSGGGGGAGYVQNLKFNIQSAHPTPLAKTLGKKGLNINLSIS